MPTPRHLRYAVGFIIVVLLIAGFSRLSPASQADPAGTQISGDITQDQTWTLDGSPYLVGIQDDSSDEIRLMPDVKVTIEPGVEVQVAHKDYFYIFGELEARGTAEQPILFTQPDAESYFKKIWFFDGSQSYLRYVTIEYGGRDARQEDALVMIQGGTHTFTDVILRHSKGHAIVVFDSDSVLNLYGAQIMDNKDRGLIVYNGALVTIRNSEFRNNSIAIRVPSTGEHEYPPAETYPPELIDVQQTNILEHTHAYNPYVSNYHWDTFCIMGQNNWWNSADGPTDSSSIIDACDLGSHSGGPVPVSDGVDWRNYLSGPAEVVGLRTPPQIAVQVTPDPSGGPYPPETQFRFDASDSSDDEDLNRMLEACFDWENSGTCTTWTPIDTPATHVFDSGGPKTVRVVVRDTDGGQAEELVNLDLISNRPPIASFSHQLAPATWGEIQLDASGSSDDETATADLLFRWDWTGDGTWNTSASSDYITLTHSYDKLGYYWPRLLVEDEGGMTDTTSRRIGILPPPVSATLTVTNGSLVMPVLLTSTDESTLVSIPAGTLISGTLSLPPLTLVHTPALDPAQPFETGLCFAGNAFNLSATADSTVDLASLDGPYTITLSYDEAYLALLGLQGEGVASLDLYHWTDAGWAPLGGDLDDANQSLSIGLTELGNFALAGPCYRIYLPIAIRGS